MYEKAIYFKNKFLRNGIILLLLSGFLFYPSKINNEPFNPLMLIAPAFGIIWIYLSLMLSKKIKTKVAEANSNEITDETFSYKQVEVVLTILLLVALFLSIFKHWMYADYLLFPVALAYLFWLFKQIQNLNSYFKA